MNAADLRFIVFSLGMGAAIASSLVSIYILASSIMGGSSIVYEQNVILAITEILLLAFAIGTCIVATEIYQRYQKAASFEEKVQN
jgi:hypothetical protein